MDISSLQQALLIRANQMNVKTRELLLQFFKFLQMKRIRRTIYAVIKINLKVPGDAVFQVSTPADERHYADPTAYLYLRIFTTFIIKAPVRTLNQSRYPRL